MARGYAPDWECRFAPFLLGGWIYITRSGHWLKKIKYEKGPDGYYHITDSYTTEHDKGRNLLVQVISEGYFFRLLQANVHFAEPLYICFRNRKFQYDFTRIQVNTSK